jgi:hypothetical protein
LAVLLALISSGAATAIASSPNGTVCVGKTPGCYSTIQAAVNASRDGDTISIAPGTYAGGVTIDKSVRLVGAAAASTIIEGGGPVVTIGVTSGSVEPTVSISRVTITGGVTDVNLNSGDQLFAAAGGGVDVLPLRVGGEVLTGATVKIADSVIAGNRADPVETKDPCSPGSCFADAEGGGISNFGRLTLTDTQVTDNVAGAAAGSPSAAVEADGGGIYNHGQGTLTIRDSAVSGNRAAVTTPNGQFAKGGGIADFGSLTIENSTVDGNSSRAESSVPSSFPADVEQEADAGGIQIGDLPGSSATIMDSSVSWNTLSSTNSAGDAQASNGGIEDDGSLQLVGSRVDHNQVNASVPAASGLLASAFDGGLQVQGVATIRGSSISHNNLAADSLSGATNADGGGIGNLSGQLTADQTLVVGNHATSDGIAGFVIGGGVLNIAFFGGPPQLTMTNSVVSANRLTASSGITPQGGGIYTTDPFGGGNFPVTLTGTLVAGNQPDQCVGC